MATVYPASTEVANLFHAYVGDPAAKTDPKWDSPSGQVYAWRWVLGRKGAAFYGTVVRRRPTFVRWSLLPAILRLVGDLRTPDELYDFGVISAEAYRIAQVLEGQMEPLSTGQIRELAGFPTGKTQSVAYHKALAELENRLLVTSEFPPESAEGIKHHALISNRRREQVEEAERMTPAQARETFLLAYLPTARYVLPATLARHLRIPEPDLVETLVHLATRELLQVREGGRKELCYVWSGKP